MKDDIGDKIHRAAPVLHCGEPSPDFQDWTITHVYFHGYVDIPTTTDDEDEGVFSPSFYCFGLEWKLYLAKWEEYVAITLFLVSSGIIEVECCISLRHFSKPDKQVHQNKLLFDHFIDDCDGGSVSRRTALEYATNGGLMCEVKLLPIASSPWGFVPENPSACETIQQFFMDKESADVIFEVEDIKFYAHSLLLKKASPLLAELCKSEDNSSPCIIHISGVSSNAFKYVLQYIYGCDSSDIGHDWFGSELIIEIIEIADKYGLTNLKLRAETFLVGTEYLELHNFMEYLQLAKSKNCYLLQEAVMDFIVENKIRILEKKMLEGAPDNITYDILSSMARREIQLAASASEKNSLNVMSLSELRRRAHARGLEVDGSREMLISALKTKSPPSTG